MTNSPNEPDLDEILKSVEDQTQYEIKDPISEEEIAQINIQLQNTDEAKRLRAAQEREAQEEDDPDAAKILVVDDSALVRKNIIFTLRKSMKVIVDQAGSVAQALDMVKVVKNYNLVTLDLNMPGAYGLEFLETLQKEKIDLPVVVISTESEKKTITEAILMGAKGFVLKPFSAADLTETLKRVISENKK